MSFSLVRPSTPPSPKTACEDGHSLKSIESQLADFQLYDLRNEQHDPRPCSSPSIDPLEPLPMASSSPRSADQAEITIPRKPFEPINTNIGMRRATAPPRIDFTGIVQGWSTDSPPLSSPMIREQHVPLPHFPFHTGNATCSPRASLSRSSSSSSNTLVDSPERKGSIFAFSPTMTRINAFGTPMEIGQGHGGECYFGPRPHLPLRQSLGGTPAISPSRRGSLFPPRPELPQRHSSYRTVVSDLGSPDLIDASTAPEAGKVYAVKPLITKLQSRLSDSLATLKDPIRIVGILASGDSGCKMYASSLAKSSEKLGVKFELKSVEWEETDHHAERVDKVKSAIEAANADNRVEALFLFLPIFGAAEDEALRHLIDPRLDVEGISAASLAHSSRRPNPLRVPYSESLPSMNCSLTSFRPYPCTPLAVAHILKDLDLYDESLPIGSRLQGKSITVINRSETVGRPLACLLANDGGQVYSVDIDGISMFVPKLKLSTPESTPSSASSRCALGIEVANDPISENPKGISPHFASASDTATPPDAGVEEFPNFTVYPAPQLSLETCLSLSDVIVSAVPSASYKVLTDSLMPGCICINVAEHSNFEENVNEKAKWLVPRVGGVTRLMVLFNALDLVRARGTRDPQARS